MSRIVVVGSGASAVHFAFTALERGHEVVMLDVGRAKLPATLPEASWSGLKDRLEDPAEYFLGDRFDAVLFPGKAGEYYGIPPSKDYVFTPVTGHRTRTDGFAPLASFAQGGLAEAWTGGSYPFNDAELSAFPFGFADLHPHYASVAQRIGISGERDDLSPFMPDFGEMLPPLDLDEHSRRLVETYERRKTTINRDHRCFMGRSRVAARRSRGVPVSGPLSVGMPRAFALHAEHDARGLPPLRSLHLPRRRIRQALHRQHGRTGAIDHHVLGEHR
jgi:hypothetical protein